MRPRNCAGQGLLDARAGIRTRPPTDRNHETPRDLGAGTLSGTALAVVMPDQKVSELATVGGLCLVVGTANAKWEAKAMRRVADELWAGSRQAIGLTPDRVIF